MGKAAKQRKALGASAKRLECCIDPSHPQVGERVYIIRDEHGWYDGSVEGVVTELRHHKDGRGIAYTVDDDEGYAHVCQSRGDVRRSHS